MKQLLILIFLFVNLITHAQNKDFNWSGRITTKNSIGIEHANIQVKSKNRFYLFMSYENGKTIINYPQSFADDSIYVTCIGFKIKKEACSNLTQVNEIILEEEVYQLNEITVTPVKMKIIKLGNLRDRTLRSSQIGFNAQSALYIPNPGITGKLLTARIYVYNTMEREWKIRPFRLRLYGGGVTPCNELISDEIIASLKPSENNWVNIDLSRFNLQFPPNGVFISVQSLSSEYYIKEGYIKSEKIKRNIINSISIGWASGSSSKKGIKSFQYINSTTGWTQKYLSMKGNFLIQLLIEIVGEEKLKK